jgi:hypothetical protein
MVDVNVCRRFIRGPPRCPEKLLPPKKAPPVRSLEAQLWDAANGMCGSVPPSDYMHVALELVFLCGEKDFEGNKLSAVLIGAGLPITRQTGRSTRCRDHAAGM